ncbi:hypothetical protein LT330_009554 [Penicillium expansum]|nr:hypothetical protein LT330_009554 [Penicillium expansum]
MNITFNEDDEEVDGMMQWHGTSGSSEDFTGTDYDQDYALYHTGAYSSADVTSLMSSEAFQQDSAWINTGPINQVPEPPQQHASDLDYIDPRYHTAVENIPQTLDDLGSSILTQRPADDLRSESIAHPSQGLDRTRIGIPNSTSLPLQPSLEGAMNQVVATYRALVYNQLCSPDQISQGMQGIDTIKNFFHSKLQPPISLSGSSERGKKLFRCWLCDPQKERITFTTFGTFKRHLAGHGILDCEWRCTEPLCLKVLHRRDRMHDHLFQKHKKFDLLPADVEATRVRYAPPRKCPFCELETSSWSVYFDHIKNHCLVSSGSANASANGDQSRHGDNNGGNGNSNGHGHGNGSSFTGPSNWNGESQSNRSNNRTGGTTYHYPSSGSFRNRGNARPGPISHSVSDNQLNSSRRQSAADAIGQISVDDSPSSSPGSTAQTPRASRQPRNIQPPQNPGSSQADHSTKRKRQDKQKKPREEKPPSLNNCKLCAHDMAKCEDCKSIQRCHKCGDVPRSSIQAGSSSTIPAQAFPETSSTIVNLNGSYLNSGALPNFLIPQNMTTQLPFYYHTNETMQFDPGLFDNMTNTFTDDPSPNTRFVGVAMDIQTHPPLRDLGDKVQYSPVVESDIRLLRSVGLGTLIDPISVKRQIKQPKPKASGVPAPGLYTDLAFRNHGPPLILQTPQPGYRCQCPCVTVPSTNYEAHAKFQLSTNERVEMTFKMSPARESSHPLRTRVRVFVKLFSLRSSAAKSKTKNQRTQPIASENTSTSDDDAESTTDSEQDLTPTSPSGSEMTAPPYLTEDVQDWTFSFDVKWAILKLAQWTSGIDVDMCRTQFLSNPRYILDLVSLYVLCEFQISWLLKGSNVQDFS